MGVVAGLVLARRNFRGADLKSFNAEAQSSQRRNGQAKKSDGKKRKGEVKKKLNTEGTEGRAQSSQRRKSSQRRGGSGEESWDTNVARRGG